jgi:hypothetical protein
MSSLNQIRESLASVQAYKLPDRYKPITDTGINAEHQSDTTQPLLDPETVQRYQNARSNFLRSQVTDLVLEHLKTLRYDRAGDDEDGDGSAAKPIIEFPESISEEEREALKKSMEAAKENLCLSVSQVKQSYEGVYQKYQMLDQRRQDLKNIVKDLEIKEQNGLLEADGDAEDEHLGSDDDMLTQAEMDLQDERLNSLMAKRSMLEAKLRKVRMETQEVSSQITSKKELLQKLVEFNNPTRDGASSPTAVQDVDHLDVEEIKAQTDQIRVQAQKLKDMSEFYESMKSATEVISGIKILSVTDQNPNEEQQNMSPMQKRRHSRNRLDEGAISLKIQLLDQHIVEISLCNTKNPSATGDCFRVVSARLLTPDVLSDTLTDHDEYENNPTPTVSINIPPLDDLVALAANLEPVQDLRFVLRETLARIRALSARMNELAELRRRYLTKITNPAKNKVNYGFGGEDQEILCSLESQITVILRLTADCPLLKGSAYIQRIVGCGGWEDSVLQKIKTKVNEQRCSGPVDLMDTVVEEINRVVQEDGVKIPKTPVLPRRKGDKM